MFEVGEINWLGVILATLAYYILGALWFTPLFGKAYDRATGVKRKRVRNGRPFITLDRSFRVS